MDNQEIIKRISILRTKNNLSARKLSQQLGKNDAYINRLECKKDFMPTFETLFEILAICNSTPEEFFYYDMDQYKQDQTLLNIFKEIDSDTKQLLISLLKKLK